MNRLADQTSPYLRQHRDNPVDWHPWGPEAFAEAKRRDVPVLLSVGYSACHWCHVMAHECFEDTEVATVMNHLFVNVKVDREERPDVDAVYMEAVQALTGRGGWPMTVFLAPDGSPFYGGTYFPKPSFLTLMRAIDDAWRNKRDDIEHNVGALRSAIGRTAGIEPSDDLPGQDVLDSAIERLVSAADLDLGGFGGAPKFPSTMNLDLAIRTHHRRRDRRLERIVATSLDAMASGGIYDHLGGGFARYSVDARWLVPHFEKMLYDQALFLRLYTRAWLAFGVDRWKQVAEETVDYVLRDLRHPDGGFYSAEDADSLDADGHPHEGAFYVWTPDEFRDVLGVDAESAMLWYGVTTGGNFEGASILNRLHAPGDLMRPEPIEQARLRLFEVRSRRARPGLDDKVLTEWNGLFLASLAEAAAVFGRPDWAEAAVRNGEFLLASLRDGHGRWFRSWQADGGARHDALAADLAALVDAFTRLAELTGRSGWITEARSVADELLSRFWDDEHGGVFTNALDGEQLIVRQKDVFDNATPSANSSTAMALLRLGSLTGEHRYHEHADAILRLLGRVAGGSPSGFANLLAVLDMRRAGLTEIAITGDRPDLLAEVQRRYLPDAVVAWGEPYESPLWSQRKDGFAYVCRDYTCAAPASSPTELADRLAASGAPSAR